jgi:hypothetical protein
VATADIIGDVSDNYLEKWVDSAWANIGADTPAAGTASATQMGMHRTYASPNWILRRIYVRFDLSSYAGATISAATLSLFGTAATGTVDFKAYYYDWGETLETTEWPSVGSLTAATATLTPTGWAWGNESPFDMVNVSNLLTVNGGLVFSLDDESTEPEEENSFGIYSANDATAGHKPTLHITYTTGEGISLPLLNQLLLGGN